MTAPRWEPLGDDTADLLSLVADTDRPVSRDAASAFLAACEADAHAHAGQVSVNRVRGLLVGVDIPARRYSSLWSAFTGDGKPMRNATPADPERWETLRGSASRNDGRPVRFRYWQRPKP